MARARSTAPRHVDPPSAGAELIVIAKPAAGLRARGGGAAIASVSGADTGPLSRLLKDGVTMTPLFGNEDRLLARGAAMAARTGTAGQDLSRFYKVEAPVERMEALAEELRDQPTIEAAYVKPPAEPPSRTKVEPASADAPPATPDFTGSQGYLGAAPGGIEALWAHGQTGGKGQGIRIIDIEGEWRFSHEDLTQVQGGMVGGSAANSLGWRNHGTAVIGEFGGDENGFGIVGISPQSNTRAISIFGPGQGSAKAIRDAADLLSPGDVLLIELHRPGPRHNFQSRNDQLGYIAVEWWEDDWAAIRYATDKGVIVVEAAGNGAENLDDAIYGVRPVGFPLTWTNPFNRSNRDSRAIVVGAGAPPPGTHGRDHGPDRSRLGFSNYGALVDAQGWGEEVTTAGYGHLQGGDSEDLWYTDQFSGTSSASPIVVGAVACVQGNRKARGLALYTPLQMRDKLRTTGSPQQDAPGRPATQRIGNRPNLKQLIGVKLIKETAKEILKEQIKDKVEIKETKQEIKETKVEKPEKVEIKEGKLEIKEKPEAKENKPEFKEGKSEFEKRPEKFFEGFGGLLKGLFGGGGFGPSGQHMAVGSADTEARLANLESAMAQLAHFIGSALRPDLTQGALRNEADVAALAQQMAAAEAQAKQAKDAKDTKEMDKPFEG